LPFSLKFCPPVKSQVAAISHGSEVLAVDWKRYLAPEWWQMEKIDQIDRQMRMLRASDSRARVDLGDEVDDLASELGKAMLLIHALIETCVRKEVLSRAEIAAVVQELDLRDGIVDGALKSPKQERQPRSVNEFLGQLAQLD
jgi:hypothetical protein